MDSSISVTEIITAVSVILSALFVIAGVVVKMTKTKKDDEVFDDISEVVKPVVDALDPKKPKV